MRLLITGSRTWPDTGIIRAQLELAVAKFPDMVMVSGHCPEGADSICEQYAHRFGITMELHPANWVRHGKRAGFLRNYKMVHSGIDACLAFIHNNSSGATHCVELAQKARILTRIIRQ